MADDYKRFIVPLVFATIGMLVTFWITQYLSSRILVLQPGYDLVSVIDGSLTLDIRFILIILIPIFVLEFLLLTLPFAFFMLLIAKIFRVATYNIDVMGIGRDFDWLRIMKRSAVPALFALSLGELVISLLQGVIFRIPSMTDQLAREITPSLDPLLTMFGALIALSVSIALFAPTWLLNDSGIVAHVKPKHLEQRRCPDTEGVGRWFSNLIGGFGILAFPITMFHRYFYQKFIVIGVDMDFGNVLVSLGWSVGLPFMVIAFILPIIILNEFTIKWTSTMMQRVAKAMGASDVRFQRVEKISEGNQNEAETAPLSEPTGRRDI